MAELTEQQVHLQQVLEQQQTLSQEAQRLNVAVQNNNAMFTKLQGVREYLEQTGVTLPEPEAEAPAEAVEPEVTES
tara:strand:- start:524 stop:751 length:228 start_codon:yes stop_codon:yes gene_type:complete